jgi:hypothetical protein
MEECLMKKIIIFLILCLLSAPVMAQLGQQETLLKGIVHNSGYGGPGLKFSAIGDDFALFAGALGGWTIERTFTIGGAAYVLVNRIEAADIGDNYNNSMGYGGLLLEYSPKSDKLVHYSLSSLVGVGLFDFRKKGTKTDLGTYDTFLVIEPDIHIELNISKYFRLATGLGYRMAMGVGKDGVSNEDLSDFSYNLILKIGFF